MTRLEFAMAAIDECLQAQTKHRPLNSLHEAYAVILEEVDELWDEVRKNRFLRDHDNVRRELIQIAAMCMRTACEVPN